jgi:hypothetical protein
MNPDPMHVLVFSGVFLLGLLGLWLHHVGVLGELVAIGALVAVARLIVSPVKRVESGDES